MMSISHPLLHNISRLAFVLLAAICALSTSAIEVTDTVIRASSKEEALQYDHIANNAGQRHDFKTAAMYKEAFCQFWYDNYEWRTPVFATHLNNLAFYKHKAGLLDEAIDVSNLVLQLRRILLPKDNNDFLATLNNLATYYEEKDSLDKAIALRTEAISSLDSCGRISRLVVEKQKRGKLYIYNRQYGAAIEDLSFVLTDNNRDFLSLKKIADVKCVLAQAYIESGKPKDALSLAKDAFEDAISIEYRDIAKIALQLIWASASNLNIPDTAAAYTSIYKSHWNLTNNETIVLLNSLADFEHSANHLQVAISLWESAVKFMVPSSYMDTSHATILINLGNAYFENQEYRKAIEISNRALTILTSLDNKWSPSLLNVYHLLAYANLFAGNIDAGGNYAAKEYHGLIDALGANFSELAEVDKFDFLDRFISMRDLAIDYYMASDGKDAQAAILLYNVCLALKSTVYSSEKKLREGLHLSIPTTDTYAVKSSLKDDETAIEFIASEDNTLYLACVLRNNWDVPKIVFIGDLSVLTPYLERPDWIYSENRVTEVIWKDILKESECKPGERIYFSPDGILFNVAIEILPYEKDVIGQKYRMFRITSTGELQSRTNIGINISSIDLIYPEFEGYNSETTNRSDFFANLTNAIEEIKTIACNAEGKGVRTHTYSSLDFLNGDIHPSPIMHIATHGFNINSTEPLSSSERFRWGLEKSGLFFNTTDNGQLYRYTASDISKARLSGVDFVALAACKSNEGTYTYDGISGIQRGFFMAGAKSVLASIWDIDDASTKLFMENFYDRLLTGSNLYDSYISSVLLLKEQTSNPFYWASFILTSQCIAE